MVLPKESHHPLPPTMSLLQLRPEVERVRQTLNTFVVEQCQPSEAEYEAHLSGRSGPDRWSVGAVPPCVERLKAEAQRLGLWNLFLPHAIPETVPGHRSLAPQMYLTNREYGILCEVSCIFMFELYRRLPSAMENYPRFYAQWANISAIGTSQDKKLSRASLGIAPSGF